METALQIATLFFAISVLTATREVPKINWRAIAAISSLMIAWIAFCIAVHPAFQQ